MGENNNQSTYSQMDVNKKICELIEKVIEHEKKLHDNNKQLHKIYETLPTTMVRIFNQNIIGTLGQKVMDTLITTFANIIAGAILGFLYKSFFN